jgi:hypothetical protein
MKDVGVHGPITSLRENLTGGSAKDVDVTRT